MKMAMKSATTLAVGALAGAVFAAGSPAWAKSPHGSASFYQVQNVQDVTDLMAAGPGGQAFDDVASCNAGDPPTGGGWFSFGVPTPIFESYPTGSGWDVEFLLPQEGPPVDGVSRRTITAYVICEHSGA